MRNLAITLLAALASGCVSNLFIVNADPSPEGTTAPVLDESTTDVEESTSSTGSTGYNIGDSSIGLTSTASSTSSSTSDGPVPQGQGAECSVDEQCAAPGWCSSDIFDDNAPYRCTRECDPLDDADACDVGVCINGGNKWRCSGPWSVQSYKVADVFVDGATLLYDASGLDLPGAGAAVSVFFVPPQPLAYQIGVAACCWGPNEPDFGPARVDVYTTQGVYLGLSLEGAPLIVDQPDAPLILVVQAATDKKSWAHLWLKNL